jgi:3-dehydroquinate synthase
MQDNRLFARLSELQGHIDPGRTLLVTDERIDALFGAAFPPCPVHRVPEGEAAKSLSSLEVLYRRLAGLDADRTWTILSIGGGSVSDLAGFAAHTWMRGIRFMAAPTTLLAMCDAALGGKNGVDLDGFKNVVGSFHLPELLFCDVECLRTLPEEQFVSGLAEATKHAVLDGEEHFAFLESCAAQHVAGLAFRDFSDGELRRIVEESQKVKLLVVARDPKESGERRKLNLGHTFGHAIESVSGLPHGHSVSLGMVLVCRFAEQAGMLKTEDSARIRRLLSAFGLPVRHPVLQERREEIARALFMDKKREGGTMNLVLPRSIGQVEVMKLPVDSLAAFLSEVEI